MSLYPSLEDMKVDQIQKAQVQAAQTQLQENSTPQYSTSSSYPAGYPSSNVSYPSGTTNEGASSQDLAMVYPSLMDEYMGLRLEPPTDPVVPMQPYQPRAQVHPGAVVPSAGLSPAVPASQRSSMMVAPISGSDLGLARANVSHGIREAICCKDQKGKVGMRLRAVDKGVFVQFVEANSPAALAGIRFGDQVLQVNCQNVAGYSSDKAMGLLKKADGKRIVLAVRDRPFERTITLHKDSSGHVGFTYVDNKITNIAKETSAARNGLLIDHHILEVNGQNIIGLKNKELGEIFNKSGPVVTLTIMPSQIYEHMIKCMADNLLKRKMDHSIPEVY